MTLVNTGPVISFLLLSFEPLESLSKLQTQLRKHYPGSPVIVLTDSDEVIENLKTQTLYEAPQVVQVSEVRSVENGGRLAHQALELLLKTSSEIFVILEQDAEVRKPLTFIPDAQQDFLGGTLQENCPQHILEDGCIILTRTTAKRLFDSGILLSSELTPPEIAWASTRQHVYQAFVEGKTSLAACLSTAAQRLGLSVCSHPEITKDFRRLKGSFIAPARPGPLALQRTQRKQPDPRSIKHPGPPKSSFKLDTSDFDLWNLPPGVLHWIVANCDRGSNILELGSGRSTRELRRIFQITTIEEDENFTRYDGVEYKIAPIENEYYSDDVFRQTLRSKTFQAIIIDGPYAGTWQKRKRRHGIHRYFHEIDPNTHLIIDDLERPWDMLNLARIWFGRWSSMEFYFTKHKVCAILNGSKKETVVHLLALLPKLMKALFFTAKYLRHQLFFSKKKTDA